ncbi:MAG: carboxymuconolactone decarboxylase family protein [Dehalococcoidia bacterium]|nr:carboxymuconolactone decarboxylase family protein [Dehalococcoidia bacterium]MSQ16584.1 carboxymuconolactone decarboxylase family protein [Dehalococcoidia bacterium]
MARIPLATRESVPATQRDDFDSMLKELKSVPRTGPGSVLIHVPKMHHTLTELNHYLRDHSTLPKKVQELAMLVAARENDCQHIWNAHAASARDAGVPDELVDGLRDGDDVSGLSPDEEAVVNYGREFFQTHRVSRGSFQAALEIFGRQGLVELTALLGNYALLAFMCNAFDTDLLSERKEPLLPV